MSTDSAALASIAAHYGATVIDRPAHLASATALGDHAFVHGYDVIRDAYHRNPQHPRTHYELTEVGDETRHVIMFAKMLAWMGIPAYRPPRAEYLPHAGCFA